MSENNEKTLPAQAHKAMHRIPGMPKHSEAKRLNSRGGLPNRPLRRAHTRHPNRKPKVLVGWQQKIARFFGAEQK